MALDNKALKFTLSNKPKLNKFGLFFMQGLRKTILPIIICLSSFHGKGQDLEYGAMVGISNYFGDLNTNASFEFVGPVSGMFFRYNMSHRFAYKVGFNYARIAFEDAASKEVYQQMRNLSFSSDIVELTNQIEFNFFKYDKEKEQHSFTPYLLLGFSVFYYNPKAEYQGEKVALQPLGTEGQGQSGSDKKKYSRISFALPIGGGFKYAFTPFWAIGIEGGIRKTFTDNLDDVSTSYPESLNSGDQSSLSNALADRSGEVVDPPIGQAGKQRGWKENRDDYLFVGVTISYSPIKVKCPKPSKIY